MSKPLHRGVRTSWGSTDSWDSPRKDVTGTEEDRNSTSPLKFNQIRISSPDDTYSIRNGHGGENSHIAEKYAGKNLRARHNLALLIIKMSLVVIVIVALTGSFWWTLSISTSSRGLVLHGYKHLQQQLVADLRDIGEISLGSTRFKELEFCQLEFDNHVPCFNVSENLPSGISGANQYDRNCGTGLMENCLILPPANYRLPLRWPTGKDVIWVNNVKITAQEVLSSGSLTKRMMVEEEQISFRSASLITDGIEDYSHQIAEMIGLRNESNLIDVGVRTILDIGCGYGSFGAHLFSKHILTICIAEYEISGSQVQLTLERGLPAMIASFRSKQLPYPSLSFDMLHCARCGIDWDEKDGLFLIEVDRVLRPGGYFVWTSPLTNPQTYLRGKESQKRWNFVRTYAESICWDLLGQQDDTVVWRKTSRKKCYVSRRPGAGPSLCGKGRDIDSPYYHPLESCLRGTQTKRWIPIEQRPTWPTRVNLNSDELAMHGLHSEVIAVDSLKWNSDLRNYWSLLSPQIFSDHPKRPGDEDPAPPYNMLRNVLDMNARFGGLNSALLEAGKSVWVMNVVPTTLANYLQLILDRGFVGVLHDWCEAFPTYPRTYDMVHVEGLLSLETVRRKCSQLDLFTEIDRILRPEGWIIFRDTSSLVESARELSTKLKWDSRIVEIDSSNEEKLLICQKPFSRRQAI
uniref:Methyltransferase n=1 Tax=Kalanchoe fedtschenkoi TaxID=63787 RepID=A0A7N0U0F1_KALFE